MSQSITNEIPKLGPNNFIVLIKLLESNNILKKGAVVKGTFNADGHSAWLSIPDGSPNAYQLTQKTITELRLGKTVNCRYGGAIAQFSKA